MFQFAIFVIVFSLYISVNTAKLARHEIDVFWKEKTLEEVRKRQSDIMKRYLNTSFNPCEHFWDYACGNWIKFNQSNRDMNLISGLRNFLESLSEINFDTNKDYKLMIAEEKFRIYTSSCLNEEHENRSDFNEFLEILKPYGSAPMWDSNWNSNEFDWIKLLAFATKLDIPVFFTTEFNKISLTVLPVYNYILRDDQRKYKEFIENILKLTGIDDKNAKQAGNEIISLEEKLNLNYLNAQSLGEKKTTTIESFIKTHLKINWKKYLSILKGKEENNLDLSEQLEYDTCIDGIIELISETKPENLANYMMWEILKVFIPLFDTRYTNEYKKFYSPKQNENDITNSRCFKDLKGKRYSHLTVLFFDKYFECNEKDVVELINEFRKMFANDINEIDWLEINEKENIIKHLKTFSIEINIPQYYPNENLDKIYSDLKVTPNKYFENWINLQLFENQKYMEGVEFRHGYFDEKFVYDETQNTLLIPVTTFMPPNIHKYFPITLNFGGAATTIAYNMIYHIIRSEKYLDSSNTLYIEYLALKGCFELYEKWVINSTQSMNEKLPDFDATPKQLFFLNYGQNRCSFVNQKDIISTNKVFTLKIRDEFLKTFSCLPVKKNNSTS